MTDWLPAAPLLAAFVAASLVLAITPGPGVLYIVTRTLAQGRRAGLASVAGVALGNFGNALGASLGLAALFAVSPWAFTAFQFGGAGYLVWLGLKALRAPPAVAAVFDTIDAVGGGRIFRDGFVVALLNPKTALFFAAFLPQFMNPDAPPMPQSVALGALFVVTAAATDSAYALAAASIATPLMRWQHSWMPGRWTAWLTAATLIGLGVFTATTGSRATAK